MVQHALAVALRSIAAVAIAMAELFQLVVQVPHSFFSRFDPFLPFVAPLVLPFTLLLVCETVRLVFLSVQNARRIGIYKGLGTPLPFRAVSFAACRRRGDGFRV